jgi:hypothetical protein
MPNAAPPEMPTSIDAAKVQARFYGLIHSSDDIGPALLNLPPSIVTAGGFQQGQRFRATLRERRVRRSRKQLIVIEVL